MVVDNRNSRGDRAGGRRCFAGLVVLVTLGLHGCTEASGQDATVPPGFQITVFAEGLRGVRTLKIGPDGMLYAVLSDAGAVARLDTRGRGDSEIIVSGLRQPYGLAFHDGWMYVGETHRVVRYRAEDYDQPQEVVGGLPTGGHWTREIVFGSDGMLYLSVGSSCNICEERDPRRAAVTRYRPDGTGEEIVGRGLRNAAGLAVHPETGAIWVSQNERDMLGDDLPPEEINILSDGSDFGWPYCYGGRIANPEYQDRAGRCAATVAPALEIQAHSAPLGMVFYTASSFRGNTMETCLWRSMDRGTVRSPRATNSCVSELRAEGQWRTSASRVVGSRDGVSAADRCTQWLPRTGASSCPTTAGIASIESSG